MDTNELIVLGRLAKRGDSMALGLLLQRIQPVIDASLRRHLWHFPDFDSRAEDVMAETLLGVARGIGACRAGNDRQLIGWVLAIARLITISGIRADAPRHAVEIPFGQAQRELVAMPAYVEDEMSNDQRTRMHVLRELHEMLDPQLQLILWLRVIEGASWAAIALELGTTPAAAKRRYQRCTKKLRSEMKSRTYPVDRPV